MLDVDVSHRLGAFALEARFTSEGRVTALFGRSGAGKTSLVNCLAGLIRPSRGRIVVDGHVLFDDRATVRSPDAAFIRRDRLPELTDHFVPVAPDLAVEVLSPSDRMADALSKVAMYLQAGTRLVWVVEPRTRSVTTYRSRTDVKVLKGTDLLSGLDVLPGFRLSLNELFTPPVFPEG